MADMLESEAVTREISAAVTSTRLRDDTWDMIPAGQIGYVRTRRPPPVIERQRETDRETDRDTERQRERRTLREHSVMDDDRRSASK